jgi:copper chaperone
VGAVQRVLGKLQGVQSVDIDLEQNKVVVKTDSQLDAETVKSTVAKTGKATEFWQ